MCFVTFIFPELEYQLEGLAQVLTFGLMDIHISMSCWIQPTCLLRDKVKYNKIKFYQLSRQN